MKKIWLFLFLMMSLQLFSVYDEQQPQSDDDDLPILIRNNHPELYCFRILEKIDYVLDEMDREIQEFTCKEEYEEFMNYWQQRLDRLESKLKIKEITHD